jgi:microcystin-dependent protein
MATPYLAEIKIVSFNFAPKGWATCNGQLLPINQNQALFSILGTTYGGNGIQNFGLPNLQGRVPLHSGSGFTLGQLGGEATHTLVQAELPTHTHTVNAIAESATVASPTGALHAAPNTTNFSPTSNNVVTPLDPSAYGATGGNQPHDNLSPYLVLTFVIALQGIYPTQS